MKINNEWPNIQNQITKIQANCVNLNISPTLVALLIAAEDHRFGSHPGVDPISLLRAIWKTIFCGKREGGSTIAMQLVRVITGRYERTVRRKITEIYYAIRLTRLLPEHEIPKIYLSMAYFGWHMNGLKQACNRLELNPSSISIKNASNIVARLKYPEPCQIDASRHSKIIKRANHIIRRHETLLLTSPKFKLYMCKYNGSF